MMGGQLFGTQVSHAQCVLVKCMGSDMSEMYSHTEMPRRSNHRMRRITMSYYVVFL